MKVAYIVNSSNAAWYKIGNMVLPQLEEGKHGATVVGLFFFDDNVYTLRKGDPIGERLASVAKKTNMLLMACDQCAFSRNLAIKDEDNEGSYQAIEMVSGVKVGCFPDLYGALSGAIPDQVITL